ncbi:MAG: SAM-dependent methyltransferase [Proteobacteria bacterium SG_bin6]|nr:MAG: SAM-dependent methyltransferase [Proteobacteria bacterium SG_bin6]
MSDPTPWIAVEDSGAAKKHAPATLRNRDAILIVLQAVLPPTGLVLEVASGSGEHMAYFAERLPKLDWQPSDPEPSALASIAAWSAGIANVRPPLALDAAVPDWPIEGADAMLCINMVHISPWHATLGLFAGAALLLEPGAPLYLYGPFHRAGVPTAESNLAFDANLRARDPAWGLRGVDEVTAAAQGFVLDRVIEMPANNLSLIYRRS